MNTARLENLECGLALRNAFDRSIHPLRADRLEYIHRNLLASLKNPDQIARELKEKGYYSPSTYVGDIERTVFNTARSIAAGKCIPVLRQAIDYEI